MKTLFIEARKKADDPDLKLSLLDNLPGKTVSLTATIQYIGVIPKIKSYLESKGKKVLLKQGAFYEGHVLGCNSSAFNPSTDTLLMITDGKFHAINNAIQLQREIYVFNGQTLEQVTKEELEAHNKRTQAKRKKFLASKAVGLLVSSKSGQCVKSPINIAKKIEALGKEVYLFESDNINIGEFENFPSIQIWVNTACFGLARDNPNIINLSDIVEFFKP
jgi:diphthamide biosynthesis enzyme Dph1/Dph2-like protein